MLPAAALKPAVDATVIVLCEVPVELADALARMIGLPTTVVYVDPLD